MRWGMHLKGYVFITCLDNLILCGVEGEIDAEILLTVEETSTDRPNLWCRTHFFPCQCHCPQCIQAGQVRMWTCL